MANKSFAVAPGADHVAFRDAFLQGVLAGLTRFGGHATPVAIGDAGTEIVLKLPDGTVAARAVFHVEDDGSVAWFSRMPEVRWWFQETLASSAMRAASATLGVPVLAHHDEGPAGQGEPPGFDRRFPRLRDFEDRWRDTSRRRGLAARLLFALIERGDRMFSDPLRPIRDVLDEAPRGA